MYTVYGATEPVSKKADGAVKVGTNFDFQLT